MSVSQHSYAFPLGIVARPATSVASSVPKSSFIHGITVKEEPSDDQPTTSMAIGHRQDSISTPIWRRQALPGIQVRTNVAESTTPHLRPEPTAIGQDRRNILKHHSYTASTSASHSTPLPLHGIAIRTEPLCQNEACKRNRALADTYRKAISQLDARIDSQKREQQSLAVKLMKVQIVLREREAQKMKCVQCQRITELYRQSSVACRQMEQRLVQLSTNRFALERQLCKLYGEERARFMIKHLKTKQENTVAASSSNGPAAPVGMAVVKEEPPDE